MKNTIKFANWLSKWSNWNEILKISIVTSLFVVIVVLLLSLKRRKLLFFSDSSLLLKITNLKNKKDNKNIEFQTEHRHNWQLNDLFIKPTYCNLCEKVMVSGVCCTYCNLHADEKCFKKADKRFKCKKICENAFALRKNNEENQNEFDLNNNEKTDYKRNWQHHWIKGNLTLNSVCYICNGSDCGNQPSLHDFKCAWCLRNAHETCLNTVSKKSIVVECDFGNFNRILLKPNLVVQIRPSTSLSINDVRLDETLFESPVFNTNEWTPLFVFANKKSGNNDACSIIATLTTILNPLQIIEMNKIKPETVLNWMAEYSDLIQFKILVCGGDGSVGWILDLLSKIPFKKFEPYVGILPLGTGNDLSRALKWGQGYLGDVDIEEILNEMDKATPIKLDRWAVKIQKLEKNIEDLTKTHLIPDKNLKLKYLNNYLSIGCDALVTLNFHRQRENSFFANRILNKFIYFKYGTIDTFLKECRHLTENIQLELDGKLIELPHLESIVILNIPFWGGGVEPWTIGQNETRTDIPKQYINDGLLEVFGIYSSFHIAQMQVSLAQPYRIGQAKHVKIKLFKRFPIQIDGEPWEQISSIIEISYFNQKMMLQKSDNSN